MLATNITAETPYKKIKIEIKIKLKIKLKKIIRNVKNSYWRKNKKFYFPIIMRYNNTNTNIMFYH